MKILHLNIFKPFFRNILTALLILTLCGCGKTKENTFGESVHSMPLSYAEMFTVDFYQNKELALIKIKDGEKYLLVAENSDVPQNIPDDITIIKQPVKDIYLGASSALDLFNGINALDSICAVSTKEKDWSLPFAKKALADGDILYAGKYSAPDYELILSENCGLAIESTMIYHTPEVKEELESFDIPVLVERSSYEKHPLGRLEWIKLYGLILGKSEEAEEFFDKKVSLLKDIKVEESKKTVAFFYITSNGSVNVRKPQDYVAEMIKMAGGTYIFNDGYFKTSDRNAASSVNMQFEAFYAQAKDADILIYNSTIDGGISSIDELIAKNSLLADFKAVKNGNVWCTDKNIFQQTTAVADMIKDMNNIFIYDRCENNEFFYRAYPKTALQCTN